jgi:arylformamidase
MTSSRYIDISTPLQPGIIVYPGDPAFEIRPYADIADSGFRACRLGLGTHCGTHVDAPRHVITGGTSVDLLALDVLCGPATVIDLRPVARSIDLDSIRDAVQGCERILLRTSSGPLTGPQMNTDYVDLSLEAARYLKDETSVRLIGIDYLSVEGQSSDSLEVHRVLLSGDRPIVLLEGLDLREAEAGQYELLCLPLRLTDADGAPARAVLRRL